MVVADRKKNKSAGADGDLSACIILDRDATMQLEKEGSKSGEKFFVHYYLVRYGIRVGEGIE